MEADLAREKATLVELSITGAADGIHLVEALPGEADAVWAVAAVETALDRAEDERATPLCIEADGGGLDQVEEVGVPQRHLDDPPLAEQGVIMGRHKVLTCRSFASIVEPARRSGFDGDREPLGPPVPWQQIRDPLGRIVRHPCQHVDEPGLGIDAVELAGLD